MNTIFTVRIKSLRKEEGKTQDDISKLLKVRRTTYGEYERGRIMPPMDKIRVLADYYNVTVDYLIGNTNEPHQGTPNEMDVSGSVKQILEYLQNEQSKLTFDGELLDEDSRELLISSLENSLKLGRMISKRKDGNK